MPENWWNTNAGQQYQNEMARQKISSNFSNEKLERIKRGTKNKKEKKKIQDIINKRNKRSEKRRADQKKKEGEQKSWWQ